MRSFRLAASLLWATTFWFFANVSAAPLVVNEPEVNDTTPAASFTFNAPSNATKINVVNGPIVSGFTTTQVNDGGTGKFEALNFANKTSVTINAGSGVNPISINNGHPAD